MHTTSMLYRRGRSGTSTVLGTLIFVGIMFTAVIPMFLVMRQADTIFEMSKHQLEIVDEEKGREYLRVEISPNQGSQSMTLKVENKGDLVTKVIRLWVNEGDEVRDCLLSTNDVHQETLGVSLEPDSYYVIVVTEKGNLFVSDNALSHKGDGVWVQDDVYVIHVRIAYKGVIFHIVVDGVSPVSYHDEAIVQKIGGTAYKAFIVDETGTYNIKIKSGGKIIYDDFVTITDDDNSVWVDA